MEIWIYARVLSKAKLFAFRLLPGTCWELGRQFTPTAWEGGEEQGWGILILVRIRMERIWIQICMVKYKSGLKPAELASQPMEKEYEKWSNRRNFLLRSKNSTKWVPCCVDAVPAPGENFYAAAAPAPTLLHTSSQLFWNKQKFNIKIEAIFFLIYFI
jgi:hypothetical protein